MTVRIRRALRAGVTLAGLAALGTSFSAGTALAGEPIPGPSASVPVDDDIPSLPGLPGGHHDHHGADDPYDYDLYQPTEHYHGNECGDPADRRPDGATQNGLGGYNGDSDDDCAYGSEDYDPERTGFRRDPDDDYGYNGYVGTDSSRDDQTYTTVRGSERMSENDDDYDYEFDEDNATRDPERDRD